MNMDALVEIAAKERPRIPVDEWRDFFETRCWVAVKKAVAESIDTLIGELLDPSKDALVPELRGNINGLRLFFGLETELVASAQSDKSFDGKETDENDIEELRSLFDRLEAKE